MPRVNFWYKRGMEKNPEKKSAEELESLKQKTREEKPELQQTPEKESFGVEEERIIREEIEREIATMELDPQAQEEAQQEIQKINLADITGKTTRLLSLAREKGVPFAVIVATKMKDPYLLDLFHDTLAKEGLYKKIKK